MHASTRASAKSPIKWHRFRIATKGEAIWKLPQGDFSYARLEIEGLSFALARPSELAGRIAS